MQGSLLFYVLDGDFSIRVEKILAVPLIREKLHPGAEWNAVFIEWADFLTNVAAKQPALRFRGLFHGEGRLLFDVPITDTEACVHRVVLK